MRPLTRAGTALAALTAAAAAMAGLAPAGAAPAAPAPAKAKVLVDDLKSPKGLTINSTGHVVVGQGAFGDPADKASFGKLIRWNPENDKTKHYGKKALVAAIAHTEAGGGGYYSLRFTDSPAAKLYFQKTLKAKPKLVKNIAKLTKANPDPYDTEGTPDESNPFGLAVMPNGDALVSDAAANAVYQVKRGGKARVLARFGTEEVSTDDVPDDQQPPGGLPPVIPAESVPTDIAVADDGTVYVSELKGFPFKVGSSRIYAVTPKAKGKPALCFPEKSDSRRCVTEAKGLSGIATFAINPAGGLLVVGYAEGGTGAFEAGCFGPDGCPTAAVWKVSKKGKVRKVENKKISAPGTVRAYDDNRFYVTDGMFGEGRLSRLTLKK